MKRINKEYVKKFCSICDNFSKENLECNILNNTFRKKYLKNNSCPVASIKGISITVLKKDKLNILGEEYSRNNLEAINYVLETKKKRLK
jgi:predicted phosphoadenosine phosphosulfate sulfurtransferase